MAKTYPITEELFNKCKSANENWTGDRRTLAELMGVAYSTLGIMLNYETFEEYKNRKAKQNVDPVTLDVDTLINALNVTRGNTLSYERLETTIRDAMTKVVTTILTDSKLRGTLQEVLKNAHKMALREHLEERLQQTNSKR